MTDDPTVDMIEETLDLVAEWLMAAYGARITAVSLEIEGHYGPPLRLLRDRADHARAWARPRRASGDPPDTADARGLRAGRSVVSAPLSWDAVRPRKFARRPARRFVPTRQGLGRERPSPNRAASPPWRPRSRRARTVAAALDAGGNADFEPLIRPTDASRIDMGKSAFAPLWGCLGAAGGPAAGTGLEI